MKTTKAALFGLALAGGAGRAAADALETITASGKLRVAVSEDFAPFGMMGPDLKPMGYDIDVATHVAEKLGVALELVPVSVAHRIPALRTIKVDLIISVLGKNAEREAVIDFANAYGVLHNAVFADADAAIAGPADLAGKSISVLRGGIADTLVTEGAPATLEIKRYEDENSNTQAFLSGQVDAIATGDLIIDALVARNPERVPVQKYILNSSPLYVGVKKGEATLVARVNEILAEMMTDGTLETISQKWLGRSIPASF